jgi:putative transposase
MPGPKPPPLELTAAERQALEQVVRAHRTPQNLVLRCRIILATAETPNYARVARQLALTIETVRLWCRRWRRFQAVPLTDLSIAARLADLPRPGAPARITMEQVCQIIAVACEPPSESARPISHWTAREIAAEVMKRGIVSQLSPRHAGRFLKSGASPAPPGPVLVDAGSG